MAWPRPRRCSRTGARSARRRCRGRGWRRRSGCGSRTGGRVAWRRSTRSCAEFSNDGLRVQLRAVAVLARCGRLCGVSRSSSRPAGLPERPARSAARGAAGLADAGAGDRAGPGSARRPVRRCASPAGAPSRARIGSVGKSVRMGRASLRASRSSPPTASTAVRWRGEGIGAWRGWCGCGRRARRLRSRVRPCRAARCRAAHSRSATPSCGEYVLPKQLMGFGRAEREEVLVGAADQHGGARHRRRPAAVRPDSRGRPRPAPARTCP